MVIRVTRLFFSLKVALVDVDNLLAIINPLSATSRILYLSAVNPTSNSAHTEHHFVESKSACFVAKYLCDLPKLLDQVRVSAQSSNLFVRRHLFVIIDVERLD